MKNQGFLCGSVLIILAVGIALRLALGTFLTCPDDVHSWALVIANFESGGGLYDIAGYNYMPPWGYLLGTISCIGEFFGIDVFGSQMLETLPVEQYAQWLEDSLVPSVQFALIIKVSYIAADVLAGYVVYWILLRITGDHGKAVKGFGLWFLCSFVITAGAVQGMFDTFSALITLLCVASLMSNRYWLAGMLISLAALMKMFPGILVFVMIGYVLMKHRSDGTGIRHVIEAAAGAALMAGLLLAPQIVQGDLSAVFSFLTARTGYMGPGLSTWVSYVTIAIYVAIVIVSVLLAKRTFASTSSDPDRLLLTMLTLNVAVIFLYPATAQYMVLLAPFLVIQLVAEDRRFSLPYKVLCIGVPVFALSRGPINLLSAAQSGLLDPGSVASAIQWWETPLLFVSPNDILSGIGGGLEYIGVLLTILVMYTVFMKEREGNRAALSGTDAISDGCI